MKDVLVERVLVLLVVEELDSAPFEERFWWRLYAATTQVNMSLSVESGVLVDFREDFSSFRRGTLPASLLRKNLVRVRGSGAVTEPSLRLSVHMWPLRASTRMLGRKTTQAGE